MAAKKAVKRAVKTSAKKTFTRTREPAGKVPKAKGKALHFVIQKHAASHLHFDVRLELDGVVKSWAVPKGPSLDPSVKRLAMQVENHPISYNTFEGTIPDGEYGGGTVMLWHRGIYEAEDGGGVESLREGYRRGDLKFVMRGERLKGSWVLVRMKRPGRPQWRHFAQPSRPVPCGSFLIFGGMFLHAKLTASFVRIVRAGCTGGVLALD